VPRVQLRFAAHRACPRTRDQVDVALPLSPRLRLGCLDTALGLGDAPHLLVRVLAGKVDAHVFAVWVVGADAAGAAQHHAKDRLQARRRRLADVAGVDTLAQLVLGIDEEDGEEVALRLEEVVAHGAQPLHDAVVDEQQPQQGRVGSLVRLVDACIEAVHRK
jgi:hypothetical protein